MNMTRVIGAPVVRVVTLTLLLTCLALTLIVRGGSYPGAGRVLFIVALVSGIGGLLGLIHSFQKAYDLWMKFADALQIVVVTVLFGMCYLFIVPIFFIIIKAFDPLRLRFRSKEDTYWIRRRRDEFNLDVFERLA